MDIEKAGNNLANVTLDNLPMPLEKSVTYKDVVNNFMKWNRGSQITLQSIKDFVRSTPESTTRANRLYALKYSVMQYMKVRGLDGSYQKFAITEFFQSEIKESSLDKSLIRKIKPHDIPTKQEFNTLIRETDGLTNVLIRALYETCCRVSELLDVKLSDCKKDRAGNYQILVYGKGNRNHKKKLRYVYMTEKLFSEIRDLLGGKVYLFESVWVRDKYGDHKPYTRQHVHRLIRSAGGRVNYANLHPHTIRHYRVTEIAKNKNIATASEYAGHSSLDITKQIYDHNQLTSTDILNTGDTTQ